MMTDETSARLSLPLLQPGQAQKEMTHNEALALLDLIVGARVLDIGLDTPPATPAIGECWIVGATPSGDWSGHAQALAGWTGGGWRFTAPVEGLTVWVDAAALPARNLSGACYLGETRAARVLVDGVLVLGAQMAAIDDPAGGTAVDAECRAALAAVLTTLRTHGLIGA
jgi:hypothetical protein